MSSSLGNQNRLMEQFTADKCDGLSPPIDVAKLARERFYVRRIHSGISNARYAGKIKPVEGGFEIYIRFNRTQSRNFNAVVAHECAHTYFYTEPSRSSYPVLRTIQDVESICDFGGRTILMPKKLLPDELLERCSIPSLLITSAKFDVSAYVMAKRILEDLEVERRCVFITFVREGGRLYSGRQHVCWTNSPVASTRLLNKIKEVVSRSVVPVAHGSKPAKVDISFETFDLELEYMGLSATPDGAQSSVYTLIRY